MADVSARLARVRNALTPREWARTGAMGAAVVALHVVGWVTLASAVAPTADVCTWWIILLTNMLATFCRLIW